ncbi:MAG: sugar transferase [Actinobacteria bacterium]|nr:sugar transferase [Actinomycetota bacterium]
MSPSDRPRLDSRDVDTGELDLAEIQAAVREQIDAVERALITGELPLLTRLNRRGLRLVQLADAGWLIAVMVGTMLVRFGWAWPDYGKDTYAVSFLVTLMIFTGALYFGGLYERDPRLGSPPVLPRALPPALGAAGLTALLNLIATGAARELGYTTNRALPMPIFNLVVLMLLGPVGVAVNRWVAKKLRTRNAGPPRLLLVGTPEDLEVARGHVEEASRGVEIAGEVDRPDDVLGAVHALEITDVLIVTSEWLDDLYPEAIDVLEFANVSVLQRVSAKETMFGLERVREVGGMPFVLLRPQTIAPSRANFKRFTDLVYLALLSPFVLVALGFATVYQLVVAGRPLLFWQTRVGEGGRTFQMVKFRTMGVRAEEDGNPQLATQDDPRIIPACRWVRATRLDELPQVWNVLKGEMSLVGPRPERPELTREFERKIPGYARRYEIPPGLTGLAQIHGRYHTDPEYKLGYDLQYLVNWSPVLDLEILIRTVWVVLARRI